MRISIFSHRAMKQQWNSEELRRDDVDCPTEEDIDREVEVLEEEGWTVQEVLRGGYSSASLQTGTGLLPRNRH